MILLTVWTGRSLYICSTTCRTFIITVSVYLCGRACGVGDYVVYVVAGRGKAVVTVRHRGLHDMTIGA